MRIILTGLGFVALVGLGAAPADALTRQWTPAEANDWYARQPWLVGSNYIPAYAINQLEMWQPETFDPAAIDRELALAASIGMNSKRVFLHDLLWQQDPEGFARRIDQFLTIAAKHNIRPMLVLFDSCWDPDPKLGPQRPPIPGVHNSGWVQGPGRAALVDPAQRPRLEAYVKGVVGRFGRDPRVLAWDLWNEPDNPGGGAYNARGPRDKVERVAELLPLVFAWARSQDPVQPLTSGVWQNDDWRPGARLNPVERVQLEQSDFITFHNYAWPEVFEAKIAQLRAHGRPIVATEWLARGNGSNVDTHLPIARRERVGMYNWGFIDGRTQTRFPWDSWERPYTLAEPTIWFHDLFRADGTPYRPREIELFKAETQAAARAGAAAPAGATAPARRAAGAR